MRLVPYKPNVKGIHTHYCQKGGYIPVFSGNTIQRGSGLGSILSGIARHAIPILKKTVLPAVVRTGKEVLSDVILKKKNFKKALIDSGKRQASELVQTLAGDSKPTRKRKHPQSVKVKSGNKRKKTTFTF